MSTRKYPRTYHFPFSEGLTNNDKKVPDDWWDNFAGKELVLTEKLDGQNNSIFIDGVFARSHSSITSNPWDKYFFEFGGVFDKCKPFLTDGEGIYGESLYAIHSIEYNKLPSYFFGFAVVNENEDRWYSWDEVEEMCYFVNIPCVPVLERRVFNSPEDLRISIMEHMKNGSRYGDVIEGIVVRVADSFSIDDFSKNVIKYVRKNHVQTDIHWTKNWRKHEIFTCENKKEV